MTVTAASPLPGVPVVAGGPAPTPLSPWAAASIASSEALQANQRLVQRLQEAFLSQLEQTQRLHRSFDAGALSAMTSEITHSLQRWMQWAHELQKVQLKAREHWADDVAQAVSACERTPEPGTVISAQMELAGSAAIQTGNIMADHWSAWIMLLTDLAEDAQRQMRTGAQIAWRLGQGPGTAKPPPSALTADPAVALQPAKASLEAWLQHWAKAWQPAIAR